MTAIKFVQKPEEGGQKREIRIRVFVLAHSIGLPARGTSSVLEPFKRGPDCNGLDGGRMNSTSPSNTGVIATVARWILNRLSVPTVSRWGMASSRVVPLYGVNRVAQRGFVEADRRLPFTPGDGSCHTVEIPVTLRAEEDIVTVCFEVMDNGVGLSLEQQGQLFKPFSQVCMVQRAWRVSP